MSILDHALRCLTLGFLVRPEKTIQWEITEDECSKVKYWTIAPAETGLDLKLIEQNCDDSE